MDNAPKPEAKPPAYISEKDSEIAKKLGKHLIEKARWHDLSSRELMEVYQMLMWYNTLPQKLSDNVIEPLSYTPPPEQPKTPRKKKTTTRKKT